MFCRGPKVSLGVLAIAVLAVGIGAFTAGQLFAGRGGSDGYIVSPANEDYIIASPVNEDSVREENDIDEPGADGEYYEVGIAIYVFNPLYGGYRREALMRSMDDARDAKNLLALRFLTGYTVWYGIDPEWRLYPVYVDEDARFYTPQEVLRLLDRRVRKYVTHVIEYGESFEEIALLWDMELSELLRINSISEAAPLEPGQKLWVVSQGPLVEIITIEEVMDIEPLLRHVEQIYVDTLAPGHTRVVQEGSDGYGAVVIRTTRRGFEIIDEVITSGDIVFEPEPRVMEVGRTIE